MKYTQEAMRWLKVLLLLLLTVGHSGKGRAAESAKPLVEVRVHLRGIREGNAIRVFRGSPLSISVDLVPVLGTQVRQARALWENEKKRFKAVGLTEEQIQKRLLYDTYARAMKERAAMKPPPVPLGKGWQQQVRFDLTQGDGRKMKVLTDVDWKRYLHRYDPQQQTLTDEAFNALWLVPPEIAKQLRLGTYELTATVKAMTSEPVRFVVKEPRSKADEAELAGSLCDFHVKRGAYDEAIRVATAALSASLGNPDSFHSWLGEAYRGKGEFAKALEHYQKSLDLYKSLHPERYRQEPPQGLLLRIHEMQAKLQSQKGKSAR